MQSTSNIITILRSYISNITKWYSHNKLRTFPMEFKKLINIVYIPIKFSHVNKYTVHIKIIRYVPKNLVEIGHVI
jgi:hypothetical protein